MQIAPKIVAAILCIQTLCLPTDAASQPLDANERLELKIYRKRLPELQQQIASMQASSVSPEEAKARGIYVANYYALQTRLHDAQVRVFEWQIFAANWVLAFVGLLTTAGVGFSGYQLWLGNRRAKAAATSSVDLEITAQKIRLQTSVVGLAILVISGVFLLMFLRDVYKIDVVNTAVKVEIPTAADASHDRN